MIPYILFQNIFFFYQSHFTWDDIHLSILPYFEVFYHFCDAPTHILKKKKKKKNGSIFCISGFRNELRTRFQSRKHVLSFHVYDTVKFIFIPLAWKVVGDFAKLIPLYVNEVKGHVPRSRVIWGQVKKCKICIFCKVEVQLQPNLICRCNMWTSYSVSGKGLV